MVLEELFKKLPKSNTLIKGYTNKYHCNNPKQYQELPKDILASKVISYDFVPMGCCIYIEHD